MMKEKTIYKVNRQLKGIFFNEGMEKTDYPWLVFKLGDFKYAVDTKHVIDVSLLGKITPIADTCGCRPAITQTRHGMIPLLDLRALFGLGSYTPVPLGMKDMRYMVIAVEINDIRCGLIVDEVISVDYIARPEERIRFKNDAITWTQYVAQVAWFYDQDEPVLVLEAESLRVA